MEANIIAQLLSTGLLGGLVTLSPVAGGPTARNGEIGVGAASSYFSMLLTLCLLQLWEQALPGGNTAHPKTGSNSGSYSSSIKGKAGNVNYITSNISSNASNLTNFITGNTSASAKAWQAARAAGAYLRSMNRDSSGGVPTPWEALINSAARRYGLPVALVKAVIKAESNFNPRAVSPAGAMGLMQLMPSTAAAMGVSDPFDPAQNIEGGVKYLRLMLDRFGQNLELALAAYNAGPAAVEKYGGIPPYRETQEYVRRVLAYLDALA